MYHIGRIFNFIGIFVCALLVVIGLILMIVGAVADNAQTLSSGMSMFFTFLFWYLPVYIAMYIVAGKALNAINDGKNNKTPHIVMIVCGALSQDIFYLLGGIFGLVAEAQENNNNNG